MTPKPRVSDNCPRCVDSESLDITQLGQVGLCLSCMKEFHSGATIKQMLDKNYPRLKYD